MPLILDIAVVLIFLFFLWRGKRRGLVKTIAGILILIVAFCGAGFLADQTADPIAERFVTPAVSDFLTPKAEATSSANEFYDMLISIGVPESLADGIVTAAPVSELLTNATKTLSEKVTYALLFLIYFVVLLLILKVLVKIVDKIFDFPVLSFVNGLGGLICGAVFGYLFILLLSIILLNTGLVLDNALVSETHILRFIISTNPFHL